MVRRLGSRDTISARCRQPMNESHASEERRETYRNTVRILLPNALGLRLPLLERVLVLELGSHFGRCEGALSGESGRLCVCLSARSAQSSDVSESLGDGNDR